MVKSKAKRAVHKAASSKATSKRAGRFTSNPESETSRDSKTNGVAQLNGVPGSKDTATPEVATDTRLDAGSIKTKSGVDLTEKVRELLLLAKEQGHLTYDDINDALPESVVTPEEETPHL